MDPFGAVGTVVGLIGGVVKIATTINELRERWRYAELSITMLSSSLWAVKTALEEIVEWRSVAADKSQKSEQLDKNLEVCIQGCAVLVAYMENRLKEIDLENLGKYDKAKFMSLDTLFKGFASDLGAQVRALQLLLTIYQCRTLSEQNEKLQQKDTKKVVRAARQSTATLAYEDKDIEDAASILSETPSRSFDFDSIVMQHQSYSRTYPKLYELMQQNFPSRRASSASTVRERPVTQRHNPVQDPLLGRTPDLPFLGVSFVGETVLEVDEVETPKETSHASTHVGAEIPVTTFTASGKEQGSLQHGSLPRAGGDFDIDPNSKSLAEHPKDHEPNPIADENVDLDDSPTENRLQPQSPGEIARTLANEQPIHRQRRSSFNSLYDDSDEEAALQHPSQDLLQEEVVAADKDCIQDTVTGQVRETEQSPGTPWRSSAIIHPPSSSLKVLDTESVHSVPAAVFVQPAADKNHANNTSTITKQILVTSSKSESINKVEPQVPERSLPVPQNGEHVESSTRDNSTQSSEISTQTSDVSTKPSDTNVGDDQQVKFLSGLLNFSFDHDIDLPLTPRLPQLDGFKDRTPHETSHEEDNNEAEETPKNATDPFAIHSSLGGSTQATQHTDNTINEGSSDITTKNDSDRQSMDDHPDMALPVSSPAPKNENTNGVGVNVHEDTALVPKIPYDRDSFINYYHYTHQNDPFHRPFPGEKEEKIPSRAVPSRSPPPIPSAPILLTPNDKSVVEESLPSLERPVGHGLEVASTATHLDSGKILVQDGRSSFQSERSTNLQVPASPGSIHSQHGTSSTVSWDSSYISRDNASLQTQGTTVSATLPNAARVISNPLQHEKSRLSLTKAIKHLAQPPANNKFSNLASKLNLRATNERNAKAQQLAQAVCTGNTSRVLFVVQTFDKPADISTPIALDGEPYAITALMRAAKLGDTGSMDILLKHNPQIIACVDNNGRTVLHYALIAGASSVVLWLADLLNEVEELHPSGKDGFKVIDMKDKEGAAPVHLAAQQKDVLIVEAMRKAGANFGARGVDDKTVLKYAVEACSHSIVKYLIKQNLHGDINLRNIKGETALMAAAKISDEQSLVTLLEHGADKSIPDDHGNLAIHYAAESGSLAVLEMLFQSIEDVTAKNSIGEQPLHVAALENKVSILSALLQIPGVQINAWTEPPHQRQPVKRAEGLAATVKLASTALHYACSAGHYKAADFLLTHGAKANGNQEDGFSPLMMACQARKVTIVSLLLLHGADPKGSTAVEGVTALHIACKVNDVPCTRMLLEHGANPLARLTNKSKETPASLALRENLEHQKEAALLCTKFQQAVLRVNARVSRQPTFTTPPNVRATMLAATSNMTVAHQPVTTPVPQIAHFAGAEEQPPPPPYRA